MDDGNQEKARTQRGLMHGAGTERQNIGTPLRGRRHCHVGLNLIWATTRCALTAPTVVPHQPACL